MIDNHKLLLRWFIDLAKKTKNVSLKDTVWVTNEEFKKFRLMSNEEKQQYIPDVDNDLSSNVDKILKEKLDFDILEKKMHPSRTSLKDIGDAFKIVYYIVRILRELFNNTCD